MDLDKKLRMLLNHKCLIFGEFIYYIIIIFNSDSTFFIAQYLLYHCYIVSQFSLLKIANKKTIKTFRIKDY